jgi:thiamine biosynthesis lipoprotein
MKRLPRISLLVVLLCLVASAEQLRFERDLQAMGTTYTIAVYGEDRAELSAIIDEAFYEVQRVDQLLSNYKKDSELSKVNREAGKAPVRVSAELFELLHRCLEYSRASEGTFDMTVGPLMKTWGFYRGQGKIPSRREIQESLDKVGYQNIVLDPEQRTVYFRKAGVELDPGGIGKGYAVDRLVEKLRENGVKSALVSASTSSIYALGTPPNEPRGWKVSIKHPKDTGKTVETVYLKDQSMSTSGNYEKFFELDGRIYSHIMDPSTGMPAQGTLSVSIVSPSTLDSEVWAKPYFILGKEWATDRKQDAFRVFFCEDKAKSPCAWLP